MLKKENSYNIAIIGHRPDKLWGYHVFGDSSREIIGPYNFLYEEIRKQLKKVILDNGLQYIQILSGMDIGIQQLGMLAAVNIIRDKTIEPRIRHMIKTIAVLPCGGCEIRWPKNVQSVYHEILRKVDFIKESRYLYSDRGEIVYQIRDDNIINASDIIISVYNNVENTRTLHALRYAAIKGKKIIRINPNIVKNKCESSLKVIMNDLPKLEF